jgi:Zn-dependent protease with chaperone function
MTQQTQIKQIPKGWKKIKLNNNLTQEILINPKQKMIASSNGKTITVNDNFFKFSNEQQISAIYHERGHLKKSNKLINCVANIFHLIFGISLALLIFKFAFPYLSKILLLMNINSSLDVHLSYLQIIYLSIGGFIGSLFSKWLVELYCDFNAIKNTSKGVYISTLKDVKRYNNIKIKLILKILYYIPNKFDEIILHPPIRLRTKLLNELD